jgi:hypothetical protein
MVIFLLICLFACTWIIIDNLFDGNIGVAIFHLILATPIIFALMLDSYDATLAKCKEKNGIYVKIGNEYKCASKIEFIIAEEKE